MNLKQKITLFFFIIQLFQISFSQSNFALVSNIELVTPPDNSLLPLDGSLEGLKPTFAGTLNFSGGFQFWVTS